MTLSRTECIKCPKCEKNNDVQLWDTINVTLDPSEKVNLFSGKINFFNCKYCDFKAPIPKSLLYHDMANKFWIYYFPVNLIIDDEFIRGNFTYEGKLKNLTRINEAFEYMSNPIIVFSMQELKNHIYFRDRLLEVEEQDAEAWSEKARVLTDQGMHDEAIQALDKAIEIDPTWATPWYNRGIVLYNQNKFDEAILAYDRAIELDPKYVAAWNNRGETLSKQGQYEDAINGFNEAIKIDPKDAIAWYNRGIALYNQDKYDEAIDAFNEVIEINPQYAEAWNFKGVILGIQGKYDESIAACDKAIDLDPKMADSWDNKGESLRRQGRYVEAIQALDEAIELNPNHADAWHNKGEALKSLGDNSGAAAAFAKAKDLEGIGMISDTTENKSSFTILDPKRVTGRDIVEIWKNQLREAAEAEKKAAKKRNV